MRLRNKRQVLAALAGIPLLSLAFLSSGCGNGDGGTDAFTIVSSISVDGGANEADEARGIALDEDGNLYATGYVTVNGNRNIWLAKYDANLILQESIVVDGPANGEDVGYVIALDGSGYVYVVGYMTETGEGHNIWLAKYDTDLILQKQITVNGSANDTDEGYGILFDGSGTLYVTGTLTEPGEGYNIWIAKYDMDLNPLESV
ncbi:MAG: SBBP repeat-containing protein, partial [Deltaproteobacteria bacterium]